MHSTDNLNDGYFGSGKRLWFSINYYGKDNHVKEILEYCETRDDLKNREKEIVNEELIKEDLCMNLVVGGEGGRGFTSEEQRLNAIKANKKIKELKKTNPEWVENYKLNSSKGQKKVYEDGRRPITYFYNRKGVNHSQKTKDKISESKKETCFGVNNSQYGTCWITKNGENKKIRKDNLDDYMSQGWIKGKHVLSKISLENMLKVMNLYKQNVSTYEISKITGIARSTILDNINKFSQHPERFK